MKLKGLEGLAVTVAVVAMTVPAAARDIDMQSIYPGSLPLLGSSGTELGRRVSTLTGGELNFVFRNPGEIVAGNEIWDALSTGAIEAAWYSPGYAEGVVPSASLFTAFPFGPDVREYTAWWYHGGGYELWNDISAPYNIHSELCSILVPEASGWFKEEIKSPEDLKGKKMRIFGLGAAVMEKLGVAAQSMPTAETMSALNLGTIDAAELSFPAIDYALGMYEHAKHLYFPGWHQQTSLVVFMMNTDSWKGLSDRERATIKEVCTANVARTMAQGEAIELEPLAKMQSEHGVTVHRWSPEMLDLFKRTWDELVVEKTASNAEFKRVWEHIQAFRAYYAQWKALGYID